MSKEPYKKIIIFITSFIVWSLLTIEWASIWFKYYNDIILRPFGYKGNYLVFTVYGIILFFFSQIYGAYRIGYYKRSDVILSNFIAIVLTNLITYLQTCLIGRAIMNSIPFFEMTIIDFLLIWIWSGLANQLYQKLYPPHQILVIYGENKSAESLIYKMNSRAERYDICEVISIDHGLDSVFERINSYNAVIICDVKSEYRNQILKYCYKNSIRVYLTPKISDAIVRGADNIHLFDTPLLLCRNYGLTFEQRFIKRAMDIFIACISLIAFSPMIAIISIAIKLYDGGPVFYKQERLTRNGKIFEIYKFRSMIVDAEKEYGACLAFENDARITPIGKIIRKIRFDEIPQIFNILKGDMSIVGPRPERPVIAAEYEKRIPEFDYRLKVKAGLTGYAQVLGQYNTTPYDKLKLDLMYIESYSLILDIKLILMTIKILFIKDSSKGISKEDKILKEDQEDKTFI
ncbi:MAG: sugar transferase [Ruminococcaceae bacterium]|nr:sugar transferase [Oscillospiraceae bacterium]